MFLLWVWTHIWLLTLTFCLHVLALPVDQFEPSWFKISRVPTFHSTSLHQSMSGHSTEECSRECQDFLSLPLQGGIPPPLSESIHELKISGYSFVSYNLPQLFSLVKAKAEH